MASLADLATNLSNFQYYSGLGNFNTNNLPANDGQLIVKEPGQQWSLGLSDTLTPFGATTTVNRTLADVRRITKFLYTTPQGPQFLIKQTGLQFSNPNIEHNDEALPENKPTKGQGFFGNIGNSISNFANKISNDYGPTRVYNPLGLSTLAQVGLVAGGAHLNKHGLLPGNTDTNAYTNYILQKDVDGNNRLLSLASSLSDGKSNQNSEGYLFKYKGGAGSSYGIGSTTIRKASSNGRKNAMIDFLDIESGAFGIPVSNMISISGSYGNYEALGKTNQQSTYRQQRYGYTYDFRVTKNFINQDLLAGQATVLASSDYAKLNLETRIGVSRARTRAERAANPNYYNEVPGASDKINKVSLFYTDNLRSSTLEKLKDANDVEVGNIRDMIKFRIKSYDNDNVNGAGVYMVFRAYINNVKRGMQSKWNPYNYVGRGESFYLYDGFTETVTLQFTIMAASRSEMKPLYQKLNYLMSTLTPDYNKQNRMRGNISELTIGDFIKYQPGIITNLDIIIDEDANWEIAIDEPENGADTGMHELPHMLKCNMTFIPIYNFLPRKSAEAPFIGIDDPENKAGSKKDWTKYLDVQTNTYKGINTLLKAVEDPAKK